MSDWAGAELFCRFAFPPNSLGYCGPNDSGLLPELIAGGAGAVEEIRRVIPAFAGAWPYLELIGARAGRRPLDPLVVEAYWLGNALLEQVGFSSMGNSMDERFRRRAGRDWDRVAGAIEAGGAPTHSFHVFCIYPWVGLLQSGVVDQALHVIDRCRIRWGEVVGDSDGRLLVRSRPLGWDGRRLILEGPRVETVSRPVAGPPVATGDMVAMHWDYACEALSRRQLGALTRYHRRHLEMANRGAGRLESKIGL